MKTQTRDQTVERKCLNNVGMRVMQKIRESQPIAVKPLPHELNSDCIDMLTDMLSRHYSDLSGLQLAGLGLNQQTSQPRYTVSNGKPIVQVMNIESVPPIFSTAMHTTYTSMTAFNHSMTVSYNKCNCADFVYCKRRYGRQQPDYSHVKI